MLLRVPGLPAINCAPPEGDASPNDESVICRIDGLTRQESDDATLSKSNYT